MIKEKLIAFDLDGTLAESKSSIDEEMSYLLDELMKKYYVAVISGGDMTQFEKQLLSNLTQEGDCFKNLYLCPTCGTKMYVYDNQWYQKYSNKFSPEEKEKIINYLNEAIDYFHLRPQKNYGELIEDRDTQITYSALGQQAPNEEKKSWDPDFEKRKLIQHYLQSRLPEFHIALGGSTSVDITGKGIDKKYAINQLKEELGLKNEDIIFVGDALMPGGNDYPVKEMGIHCIEVGGPDETKEYIRSLL